MTAAPRLGSQSLGSALGSHSNSLGALRLIFAGCVIVSHAWWLGGYGPEPELYGIKLGTFGVMGFFAISGYLITVSAERATPLEYVAARFLRIYPAMAASAFLVAFLAAPLGALITHGRYSVSGALSFLGSALGLSVGFMDTPPIAASLLGNHDRLDWDGPLWTLTWEVVCYGLVGLAVFVSRKFSLRGDVPIFLLFAASTGAIIGKLLVGGFGPNRVEFVYGTALAPLPLAYAILSLGSLPTFSRLGSQYNVSYGVYLYGWPVQQLLAAARVPLHVPVLVYATVALALVWPLAFLSCVAVEHPAQRLRRFAAPASVGSRP